MAKDTNRPRHKDSVTNVRYDPGASRVSASCSLDGTIKINSCYEEEIDGLDANPIGPFAGITSNDVSIFKFNPGAWINTFCFSSDGSQFVWATHDSELHFCSITEEAVDEKKYKGKPQVVPVGGTPILCGQFVKGNVYVGSGYDKSPLVFKNDG